MGRGEPGGGGEREIRRKKCAIAVGRWVWRQTTCLVSVLTNRGIDNIKKRPIYAKLTSICTTSSHADPQMRGNLNVRVPLAQGAFVRDGC